MSGNLFTFLRSHFPADAKQPCLETEAGRVLSYAALVSLSGRIANVLTRQGLEPGDRVAVQVEKSAETVALYLATLRAGAIFLPLNTGYTLAELGYFIADAKPRIVIGRPQLERDLKRLAAESGGGKVLTLGEAGDGTLMELTEAASSGFDDVDRAPDDLASILYTSGTTGRSKGAMLTIDNLASNAAVLKDYWRFGPGDVLLHALPIFHVHGLFVALNVALMSETRILFLPRFDVGQVLRLLPRATAMMGVPTFYTRLLAEPAFTREQTRGMRLFVSGSAPLLAETHASFAARTGHVILERYGMTETGMLCSNPYEGERVAGTVGFPLPGVTLRIADETSSTPLPQGEVGGIQVAGPNVFKGYWELPDKTRAEFTEDGFFRTGDVGKIDARGYLHIVGRAKDLIITGGFNVYPKEIETLIDALPGVEESAVIGLPHPDFGEGVAAVVVPAGQAEADEAAVIRALSETVAKFKLPKRVFFVESLPRNAMGKVQKAALRASYKDAFTA